MEWLKDILRLVCDNYSLLIAIIVLIVGVYRKIKIFLNKSKEEQIDIIKKGIQQRILKMVADAEKQYCDLSKSGEIKHSQVISEIYYAYPALTKLVNQTELIEWIDNEINTALSTLRDILDVNKEMR